MEEEAKGEVHNLHKDNEELKKNVLFIRGKTITVPAAKWGELKTVYGRDLTTDAAAVDQLVLAVLQRVDHEITQNDIDELEMSAITRVVQSVVQGMSEDVDRPT
jgi:hypothetical protein